MSSEDIENIAAGFRVNVIHRRIWTVEDAIENYKYALGEYKKLSAEEKSEVWERLKEMHDILIDEAHAPEFAVPRVPEPEVREKRERPELPEAFKDVDRIDHLWDYITSAQDRLFNILEQNPAKLKHAIENSTSQARKELVSLTTQFNFACDRLFPLLDDFSLKQQREQHVQVFLNAQDALKGLARFVKKWVDRGLNIDDKIYRRFLGNMQRL